MASYINYGKSGIFKNEEANAENKRPHFSGSIEITTDIPKGTKLQIAGWENRQGDVLKSIGLSLSSKIEESENTYEDQKSGKSYNVDSDVPF